MAVRNFYHQRALLPLLVASTLYSPIVMADEDSSGGILLEQVEVVGETTNVDISAADLAHRQASDLSDIFRQTPSVSVGGSIGIAQKIFVRGLEDTQLNITVDGAQQMGTLFHHTGRVTINPDLMKAVEVQAGAGEATAGPGATGGAIKFVTKDADDLLRDGQQFGALVKANWFSNDGHRESVSLYGKVTDALGFLASYVNVDRNNYEDGDGNEVNSTASDQDLGFLKLHGDFAEFHHWAVSYEKRQEEGDFAQRPNWPANNTWSREYPLDSERETITFNHQYTPSDLVNLKTTAYHTRRELVQNVIGRWGRYSSELESTGLDLRNTSIIGEHEVIYGIDYRHDEVTSQYLDVALNGGNFKQREVGDVFGAYIQDHWQATDDLLISYGVRYDNYDFEQKTGEKDSTDSNRLSPNVGMQYQLTDAVTLSAGHARAMRGKIVGDGFTLAGASVDDGLEPEKVKNTELGVQYTENSLNLKASVYYSTIDDVILNQLGQGTVYENAGEVTTKGLELSASYQWNKMLLSATYSHNDARLNGNRVENYEHNGLANSRGDTYNVSAQYMFSPNLQLGWNFTYVDSLDNIEIFNRAAEIGWVDSPQEIDKPSYAVHDIYLTWLPLDTDTLTVNFSVQNLFDKQYIDHSSVGDYTNIAGWAGVTGQPERGRDVRLTVSYKL